MALAHGHIFPPDYHMHTRLCRHAVGDATDLAAQAVKLGLSEIGFSEHNPMPRDDFDDWHPRQEDLAEYVAQVEKARRDHPQLQIKLALEMDYIPGMEDWIQELAGRYPWDYLIGAVHYVAEGWDLDNPAKMAEWKRRDIMEVWTEYFARLTRAAESGFFDIIAHPDLCKKFGFYPQEDCTGLFTRLLDTMQKHDLAMELNTAGLRKDCREIYPGPRLVSLAAERRLPITFGSDAHAPAEVGMQFGQAVQLAREFGYSHACRFTGRKRESIPF